MIPYLIALVGSYLIGESMQDEEFADGGPISMHNRIQEYQIKKADGTYFYLKMSTGSRAWSKSPDMAYLYTEGDAGKIKSILEKEGVTGLSIVKYDKDWWKNAPDEFAKGGKLKKKYAILRSPMGEIIADIEVETEDRLDALKQFIDLGIDVNKGTIYFTDTPPYYYADGGRTKGKNFKPALEFDKKYGTSISKTDWEFPENHSADYVYEKIITPMFRENVSIKKELYFHNYLEKLEKGNYFPYDFDRLIGSGRDMANPYTILNGMASGFNYDDIVYFIEDWEWDTRKGQSGSKKREKELMALGVDSSDIQWVVSPKTVEKIKKQLTNPRKDLFGKTLWAKGGVIGDAARVKSKNKTGVIMKILKPDDLEQFSDIKREKYYVLRFVDGTQDTYSQSELEIFKN